MKNNTTIGVIGHTGTVGSRIYSYFKKKKYRVAGISRVNTLDTSPIFADADVIFICVPTPFRWKSRAADMSIVKTAVTAIARSKTVVIKSTVLPGTTDQLQKIRPDLRLLFSPEFLSRKTATSDFMFPDRQIVGYTKQSKRVARSILEVLPRGAYNALMKSADAELVKYAHNIFGAIAVIYANHLFDAAQAVGADYRTVLRAFTAVDGLSGLRRYGEIFHNTKRGFGGSCFPKDINSFLVFCRSLGVKVEVIEAARNANKRLLKLNNLTEQSAEPY